MFIFDRHIIYFDILVFIFLGLVKLVKMFYWCKMC